jgi:hypothetical protein
LAGLVTSILAKKSARADERQSKENKARDLEPKLVEDASEVQSGGASAF